MSRCGRLAWLLTAAVLATPATARAEGAEVRTKVSLLDLVYVGARGGDARAGQDSQQLEIRLANAGTPAVAGIDRSSLAYTVYAGFELTAVVALEAGFADLGQYKTTVVARPGTDIAALTRQLREGRPVAGQATSLAVRYDTAVYRNVHVQSRFGPFYWRESRDYQLPDRTVNGNRDGFGLLFGGAVNLHLGRHLALGVGADVYRPLHTEGVRVLFGQMEYRF